MRARRFEPFAVAALTVAVALWGCDSAPAPEVADPAPAPAPEIATAPEILPLPFTAEQIRDEWVEGFSLVLQTETPKGQTRERWTVLSANEKGAEIEFVPIDAEGNAAGNPRTSRSSWEELRDHAAFPAAVSSREEIALDTALGQLDGWIYRTRSAEAGTESEFFFASSLPGAPVQMRVMKGGETVLEMAQLERHKPEPET
ncbi:MAG: hypothetical protein GY719_21895 [bacterium]|nr:hypothetical protein [bacterium]